MLVRAAGGVLWRPGDDGLEVALVHRPRYDDWSLPKGKLDPGEHPLEAAVREVREETGAVAVAGRALGTSRYPVLVGGVRAPKTVDWWALRCLAGSFTPSREVDELRWLPVPAARALLTAGRDGAVLDALLQEPAPRGVLALVRHGSAGHRDPARDDDDDRPLDDRGRAQAARLAALLPLHGIERLVSAPQLRCRQTLEPTAARLGLAVEVEPLLSDSCWATAGPVSLACLRALPEGTAVCGQGEGLAGLVQALGGPGEPLPKGAARVLTLDGDRLVAADLLDPEERRV